MLERQLRSLISKDYVLIPSMRFKTAISLLDVSQSIYSLRDNSNRKWVTQEESV
jgi:hypothetical protein